MQGSWLSVLNLDIHIRILPQLETRHLEMFSNASNEHSQLVNEVDAEGLRILCRYIVDHGMGETLNNLVETIPLRFPGIEFLRFVCKLSDASILVW